MAIYIDGQKADGSANLTAAILPVSSSDPTNTKAYIDGKTAEDIKIESGSATDTKSYIDNVASNIPTQIQDLSNVVFGTLSGGQVLTIESGTGNVVNVMPAIKWQGNFNNIGHLNWDSGVYLYSYDSNSTSAPTTSGGYAMSFFNADNNKYGCQVAFTNGGFYWRKLTNNTYGAWVTLAT